ncbi:MAG: MFS transporter [Acidobacteriota bacterium]
MGTVTGNPRLLCLFRALQMALFPMAIYAVFLTRELGFTMTQLMVLQAGFGATVVLCEFPSGYLADRLGYRRTLCLASIVMIAGWSIYSVGSSFPVLLMGEVFLAIGTSLISGADVALLYESLEETDQADRFTHWNGLWRAWGQGAEGSAALLAGLLFAWWARAPFVVQLLAWSLALVVAWRLVEPDRVRPPATGNWQQVKGMLRLAWHERPRLRAIIVLMTTFGMSSFVPVWIVSVYAKDAGLPDAWLGVLWALANYSVAAGALLSSRLERRLGLGLMLGVATALVALGYFGLALTHALGGFVFYYAITFMRGLLGPVLDREEQQLLPSGERAGFVSLRGLVFRGSFLVIGPVVGRGVDHHGEHVMLLVLGIGLTLACTATSVWFLRLRAAAAAREAAARD